MASIPQPPRSPLDPQRPESIAIWRRWFEDITKIISTLSGVAGISWDALSKAGSNLADLVIRNHNDLENMQGGSVGQRYHLTSEAATTAENAENIFLQLDQTEPQNVVNGSPVFDALDFNLTPDSPSGVTGRLRWNSTEGTLDLGQPNDVTQQIGQETFFYIKNQTGAQLSNGKSIMFAGAVGASGRLKGQYAIADGTIPAQYIMGIATQDIADAADGFVTTFGKVRGIDTSGTPYGEVWADGDVLYVSPTTPGGLTKTVPNAPNLQILVAAVVNAHAVQGTLFVRPTFVSRLTDLDDVNGTPLTVTGQFPVWNNTAGYFDFNYNITNYFYKPGLAGGQTAYGGAAAGENLTIGSTAHATKGKILFGTSQYDENINQLRIGTDPPDGDAIKFSVGNTNCFQVYPDFAGTGEIPAQSAFVQVCGAGSNMVFAANITTSGKTQIAYFNGTAWYSGLEISQVASGFSNLLLMKTGGQVGVRTASPQSALHLGAGSLQIGSAIPLDGVVRFSAGNTNAFQIYPDFGGTGEIPGSSAFMQITGTGSNMVFAANTTTSGKTQIAYFNGTQWYSGLEVSQVASGFSSLLLMKSGGKVGIGTTSAAATLTIKAVAAQAYNLAEWQNSSAAVLSSKSAAGVDTSPNYISTVATGTQPYACTSTTVNTNLNADMLDGKHTGTSGNTVPLLDGNNTWSGVNKYSDNIVLPKTSGKGIQVDTASPSFGFRDLLGEIKILSPGANDPTLAVFRDSIRAFSFSNAVMNEANFHFHIPHDYVSGSDIFIHAHWSQNVVDTGGPAGAPGDVKWQFEVTYAKGHNQAAFPATFTTSVTQTASGTQYQHMLAEVQLSAASPSATQIDSDILEPDGVIIVRAFRDPADVADTLNQVPFMHYTDIHYQSTNMATKAKAPSFYT